MATAKRQRERSGKRAALWLAVFAAALIALWAAFGSAALGYGRAGSAYAARVACSCRFVAGRSLEDCAKDKLAGMELVSLSEDAAEKSVSARMLVVSDTARLVPGSGCMLDPWDS